MVVHPWCHTHTHTHTQERESRESLTHLPMESGTVFKFIVPRTRPEWNKTPIMRQLDKEYVVWSHTISKGVVYHGPDLDPLPYCEDFYTIFQRDDYGMTVQHIKIQLHEVEVISMGESMVEFEVAFMERWRHTQIQFNHEYIRESQERIDLHIAQIKKYQQARDDIMEMIDSRQKQIEEENEFIAEKEKTIVTLSNDPKKIFDNINF